MRTALGLIMVVTGIVAVRSSFAPNPDPRVVIGRLFGVDTSGIVLINDPGPSFGPMPSDTVTPLSPENIDRIAERAPRRSSDPNMLGRQR